MRYFLVINSWRGICPGAQHFYGRIHPDSAGYFGGTRHDLEHEFTVDGVNHMTIQFESKQAVIDAGKIWFKENATEGNIKPGDVLFVGQHGNCDPMRIIGYYGKRSKFLVSQALWRQSESISWEKNEKEMQALCDRWDLLWP